MELAIGYGYTFCEERSQSEFPFSPQALSEIPPSDVSQIPNHQNPPLSLPIPNLRPRKPIRLRIPLIIPQKRLIPRLIRARKRNQTLLLRQPITLPTNIQLRTIMIQLISRWKWWVSGFIRGIKVEDFGSEEVFSGKEGGGDGCWDAGLISVFVAVLVAAAEDSSVLLPYCGKERLEGNI